jgi:hypothetical protein
MFTIYLAGYISGQKMEECSSWRKKIREHYENWTTPIIDDRNGKIIGYNTMRYPICWLDPLNGKDFEDIDSEGLKAKGVTPEAIVHRDYNCVRTADLIVANLDTFGCTRPLTGTMFELAWAYESRKPVIVITQEANYKHHPFITETASVIVSTVNELLEKKLINYFFKGQVNAIY